MRYVFSILIFSLSLLAYGQDKKDINIRINNEPLDSLPKFVIIMDKTEYSLDSIPNSINPSWIDKIEVLKSEEQKYIFGNGNGVVLIYPKKKYFKQICSLLETIPKDQEQIDKQTLDSIYGSTANLMEFEIFGKKDGL